MRVRWGVLVLAAVAAVASPPTRPARAEAERVGTVDEVRLRVLDGGPAPLFDKGSAASVLVFFRAGHDRSLEALRAIGECQATFAAKSVRFVGIVSDREPADDVRAALAASGAKLPVMLDDGDALYARLGIRTHPAIYVVDKARRIVAFETYRQVGLCEAIRAHVRRALGELSDAEVAKTLAPAQSQMPGDDPLGVAARHVKFGRKLLGAGSIGMVHESARKSLAIAPSAAAWSLEGDAFRAEKNCAEAVKAYETALKLDAADPNALSGRKACAL